LKSTLLVTFLLLLSFATVDGESPKPIAAPAQNTQLLKIEDLTKGLDGVNQELKEISRAVRENEVTIGRHEEKNKIALAAMQKNLGLLEKKVESLKIDFNLVNTAIGTSSLLVAFSGLASLLVTVVLVFLGLGNIRSINLAKQEAASKIDEAEKKLKIAEDKFQNFITSPELIQDAIDQMNLMSKIL